MLILFLFSVLGISLYYGDSEKVKVRPSNCAALSNQEMWIYAETLDKKSYQVALMQFCKKQLANLNFHIIL
jgi:hypothetical protein